MRASIEKIKKNKDGVYVLEVLSSDPQAEALRLGTIDLTQKAYSQRTLGATE